MLFQKPMSPGEVVSAKLSNGDEIVGRLVAQDAQSTTLAKPVLLATQSDGHGMQVGFMPFMFSASDDANVTLPAAALLTRPARTRADVAASYQRATSDIEVASVMPPGSRP